MSSIPKSALLIFSKSPQHGCVKTRLQGAITSDQCLSLHVALLKDTIASVQRISTDLILYFSDETKFHFRSDLRIKFQRGEDLGARMSNAFADELKTYSSAVIVGTDCPALTADRLNAALHTLEHNDVVIGPSEDGGYYLIGMRVMTPHLFLNIPWGTSQVFPKTLAALTGRKFALLETYYDVDRPEDLKRLNDEVIRGEHMHLSHTREWLKRNLQAVPDDRPPNVL